MVARVRLALGRPNASGAGGEQEMQNIPMRDNMNAQHVPLNQVSDESIADGQDPQLIVPTSADSNTDISLDGTQASEVSESRSDSPGKSDLESQ